MKCFVFASNSGRDHRGGHSQNESVHPSFLSIPDSPVIMSGSALRLSRAGIAGAGAGARNATSRRRAMAPTIAMTTGTTLPSAPPRLPRARSLALSTFATTSRRPAQHHRPALSARPLPAVCRASEDDDSASSSSSSSSSSAAPDAAPRSDDVLPDSLTDAIHESAKATVDAMNSGFSKCVVEILLPDFWDPNSGPVYSEEGDQQRFWKMTKRFIDDVVAESAESAKVKAIYPDAGVAAMLRNQWDDASFSVASLNDRKPVDEEDELVVMAAPDPPSLDDIVKISNGLLPTQTLVMFNPRLASGDVGVGLAMRRLRERFMGEFMTTYSLRPIGDIGSVFKRFPSQWQVFIADKDAPGRYVLAAERPSRPGGEELDLIVMNALGGGDGDGETGEELGLGDQVSLFARQMQRFMKSLTN